MRRGSIFLLVVAILAAGCGGSTKSTAKTTVASSPTTSTVAPSTTSTSAAPPTTDAALAPKATAALFKPADFPLSFKAQPDVPACPADQNIPCSTLNLETVWHDIITCLGVPDNSSAVATSQTYLQGLATQARATVEYTTASAARTIQSAFTGASFQGCATKAFTTDAKKSAPSGATPGPVVITALAGVPQLGQKVSASRINVTMNLSALQVRIFQDFVVVFNGGTIVRMFFLNPGSGFPTSLEQSLLQKVVTQAGAT